LSIPHHLAHNKRQQNKNPFHILHHHSIASVFVYFPQSSITAENTLAYKSLVEDPKELLFIKPVVEEETCEKMSDERGEKGSTLPRVSNIPLEHVPQSNKAATLSKLLRITKDFDASTSSSHASTSSPLKALRDKSFPIGKSRLRNLPSVGSESVNSTTFLLDHDGDNPCETPSYMANADGNFPLSVDMMKSPPKAEVKPIERNDNPLPLPPKNRNALQLNVTQKRHVRKHPLIIPAMATQRTLDKINQVTPVEDKSEIFGDFTAEASNAQNATMPTTSGYSKPSYELDNNDDDDDDVFEDLKKETKISQEFEANVNNHYGMIKAQEKNYTKDFIENNFPSASARSFHNLSNGKSDTRTYQNIEDFQKRFSCHDQSDTASLHFESILEDESSVKISDDMVDGFGVFETDNNKSTLIPSLNTNCSNSNSSDSKKVPASNSSSFPFIRVEKKSPATSTSSLLSTVAIEAKKNEFSQKFPKYKMPRNELASNALFNKIKESVEMAAAMEDECEIELETENHHHNVGELKRSINHVSCEDLLDFSDKKPLGIERGDESDEVRIIRKMFGSKVS
jgi:hypothetical protein